MPDSLPRLEDLSTYTQGMETDNPILKLLSTLMMGNHYMPRPVGTQSTYDAYLQQARSQNFLRMQANAGQNNQLFMSMGINPNSDAMKLAGLGFGGPNSPAMQMLAPLIGGNPVAAQMQMYAGFTGTTMGAFGRMDNSSYSESQQAMNAMTQKFYNWKPFDTQAADKKVVSDFTGSFKTNAAFQSMYGTGTNLSQVDQKWIERYHPKMNTADPAVSGMVTRAINEMNSDTADSSITNQQKQKIITDRLSQLKQQLSKTNIDRAFLDKYLPASAIRNGTTDGVNAGNLDKMLSDGLDPAAKAQLMLVGNKQMDGTKVIAGINYANTRGFNLEDFTSASVALADLRLAGHHGQGIADLVGDTVSGGGGMLSAARSVFGRDKSGGQLVNEISRLLGSGTGDSSQIEKMLRDMKSAARIAGTSIDAVLGITKEAQALAQSRPGLQYMSGANTVDMVNKALLGATYMNSQLTGAEVRRMGGIQGMVGSSVASQQELADSPITKQIAALSYQFKGNEQVQAILDGYANGPVNMGTLSKLYQSIGNATGTGEVAVSQMANDATRQSWGMADDQASKLGLAAVNKGVWDEFSNRSNRGGVDIMKSVQQAYSSYVQKNGSGDGFDIHQAATQAVGNNSAALYMLQDTTYGPGLFQHMTENLDDAHKKAADDLRTRAAQDSKDEAEMSRRLDYSNASGAQQIFQKGMNGDLTSFASAFDVFKDYDENGKPKAFVPGSDAEKAYNTRVGYYTDYAKSLDVSRGMTGDARRAAVSTATQKFLAAKTGGKLNASSASLDQAQTYLSGFKDLASAKAWMDGHATGEGSDVAAILKAAGVTANDAAFKAAKDGVNRGDGLSGLMESSYDADVSDNIENSGYFKKLKGDLTTATNGDLQSYASSHQDQKTGAILSKLSTTTDGSNPTDKLMRLIGGDKNELLKALQGAGFKGGLDSKDFQDLTNDPNLHADITKSEKLSQQINDAQQQAGASGPVNMDSMMKDMLEAVEHTLPDAINRLVTAFGGGGK